MYYKHFLQLIRVALVDVNRLRKTRGMSTLAKNIPTSTASFVYLNSCS